MDVERGSKRARLFHKRVKIEPQSPNAALTSHGARSLGRRQGSAFTSPTMKAFLQRRGQHKTCARGPRGSPFVARKPLDSRRIKINWSLTRSKRCLDIPYNRDQLETALHVWAISPETTVYYASR